MGLPRPPGFAGIKSWLIGVFNTRFSVVDPAAQSSFQYTSRATRHFAIARGALQHPSRAVQALIPPRSCQTRAFHQFTFPRTDPPKVGRIRPHPTSFFLCRRPPVGALPCFPKSAARTFHSSPATNAVI